MDINCTHSCFYQQDGKCTLHHLPTAMQSTNENTDIDCPYYATRTY